MQICLCDVNVAIDLSGLSQIPAPATDQSCAATSSANTLIGVGCPHAAPSCANLHSARRSRRHRLPFPAGSFIEGFRTPATVQAASLRSAGIRNPQQERKSAVFHCNTLSARERRQSCQPLVCYDQFKSRGGWIGKSPGHNATPRMLRDRNRSREKRLYGPDGRPSARVLIFRKRSGTISESARLVCGTDGGPLP